METGSRVPDIHKLTLLESSAARFTRLLTMLRKDVRRLISPEYKVQERRPRGQVTRVNNGAGYAAGDTSIVVDDSTIFSLGDIIEFCRAREMGRITDINYSTHTLTVTRGVGSTAASLNDDDYVLRIARVENEGYTVGASFVTDTTQVTNYVSCISTPVEWTNYQAKEASYLSTSQKESRMKADEMAMAIEHLREIDRQLLFSRKSKTTDGNSKNLYTTQGLFPSLTTNAYNHSGGAAITEAQWSRSILEPAWAANDSPEKYVLCANKVLSELEAFGRDKYRTMDNDSQTAGFEIVAYRTTRGTVKIVHCPHFDAVNFYNEGGVVADFKFLRLAIFEDTRYEKDLQPKNIKAVQNEWCTAVGLDIEYEEAHVSFIDVRTGT